MKFVVVFDLDGTLVDSVELHAKAFKFAVKSLGYKNIEKLYKEFKKLVGIQLEEIIKILIPNISSNEIKKIRLLKDKYFIKNIGKIRKKRKVINILKELKQKNIKIALFTSSSKKITRIILKKFKLEKYFDYLVCKEDVKNSKPNKEGLIKIMNKFKTKNLVFIGDSKYDKLAAKNAKIKFLNVKKLNKEKIYKILGID